MAYTERVIGDPKSISRRDMIAGVATVALTLIAASAIGGAAIGTYKKVTGYVSKRIEALYANDRNRSLRLSHKNQEVLDLYTKYLSPGDVIPARSELSHRLCHTTYGKNIEHHIDELKKVSLAEAEHETAEFMATQKK